MQPHVARTGVSTAWMDLARVVAMVLVVLDHAVINLALLAATDTSDPRWWLAEPLLAVSRLAVPIFIMVSGALLLDPAKTDGLRSFARRRLSRVGVPLLFWAGAYIAFRHEVLRQPVTGETALRDFVSGSPYYHLYYLYIALGLYALTPFLRRLIAAVDERTVAILCAMAFTLGMGNQLLRTVLHIGSNNGLTMFVDYVGFYLAGWLLRDVRHHPLARRAGATLVAALAGVVLATWVLIELGHGQHWFYPSTYLSPAVVAASIALFVLLQTRGPGDDRGRRFRPVADLALGTYLIHPMVLDLIRRDVTMPDGVPGLLAWVVGLTVTGVLAGMAITFVARQVPVVRRVF